MNFYGVIAAFIVALMLTLMFSTSFRHKGPFGGLLVFFLVVFLASWAGQLWIAPVGPVALGVAWIPLVFTAILFAVILLAAGTASSTPAMATERDGPAPENASMMAIGTFFWFILVILLIAIAIGYYHMPAKAISA